MLPFRKFIPALAAFASFALFFKLPNAPHLLNCKMCLSGSSYFPLVGIGYFFFLMALFFFFPRFPSRKVAGFGLFFAILLALVLMVSGPLCFYCLASHLCHNLIWLIWLLVPGPSHNPFLKLRERLSLIVIGPLTLVIFFATLNQLFSPAALKKGDLVPYFAERGSDLVINFIAPYCLYCKEQLPIVESVTPHLLSAKFIHITPGFSQELIDLAPHGEWIEDREGKLRDLFKVTGYPTLFLVNSKGKIEKIIPGVPDELKNELLAERFN